MKETARRKSERRRHGHKQQDIDKRTQKQRESDRETAEKETGSRDYMLFRNPIPQQFC